MKLICVGFWKTGTKSLAAALKLLGYHSLYDYEEQYLLLNKLWPKFFNGTVTDEEIRDALRGIDVLIDGPTVVFWEEIYKVFPEAKIILTLRDEESWWESFKNMNDKFFNKRLWRLALLLSPSGSKLGEYAQRIYFFAYGMKPFNALSKGWNANERLYKLKYRMHKAHVMQTVTPQSLLVQHCEDGWEPLCDFLGVPIPGTVAYPHKNKAVTFFQEDTDASYLFRRVVRQTIFSFIVLVALALVFGWFIIEYGYLFQFDLDMSFIWDLFMI